MSIPPYIADILSQPQALQAVLEHAAEQTRGLEALTARLRSGAFDRVLLTGMGASHTVSYPAWLKLSRLPIPVSMLESAELLHYARAQVSARTLVGMTSQSGYSVEIVALLEAFAAQPPAAIIGTTNDLQSPLAQQADVTLGLYSGAEATVSTRSYVNSLTVSQLAAIQLTGGDVMQAVEALRPVPDQIAAYLADYERKVDAWKKHFGLPQKLLFVGRGASLAAVWTGAMVMKEAAKWAVEGMSAAQFRHGPLELADSNLALVVFEGSPATAAFNRSLAVEVQRLGGKVMWISSREDADLPTMTIPQGADIARPIFEILPLQMLSIALAEQNGVVPGKFRNMGKVTTTE
jgi:glucosamine--fructose-6-phosphate aminotransferase (isomerizing)